MNELIFFSHILLLIAAVLFAIRLGKSALIALLGLQVVIGNLFVTKQMVCFGFHVTCSDVYTIGALFSLNLLQEYYGKQVAKRAIWTAFFILFFFVAMSQIHLRYIPSPYDTTQGVFQEVLAATPRIMVASFAVGLFCQRLDVFIYGLLKKKFSGRALVFRFGGASLVSQLIDTVLFSFLALYGLVHSMSHIIILSYLIKVSIIFCMAPFTTFAKRFVRDPVHI